MSNKYQSVNQKLQESNRHVNQVMASILPEEKPLQGPTFYSNQPQHVKKCQKMMQNPEDKFINTIKNSKALSRFAGGLIQENKIPMEKTSKNFYTPHKQKLGHKNSQILQPLSMSQVKGARQSRSQIHKDSHTMHKSSVQMNLSARDKMLLGKYHKTVLDLDPHDVLNYVKSKEQLGTHSSPQQIFDYFYQLVPYFQKPLIKKFKNCLYFGDGPKENGSTRYTGFLYFFNGKIYYGNFQNDHKHGKGVEISIKSQTIYSGTFDKGHKVGKFTVVNTKEKYQGHLHKGKYNGRGKLNTGISIYEGTFYHGCRHGYGEQLFFKSGLKLTGYFNMDQFSNNNEHRENERQIESENKRLIKNSYQKPKLASIFQFQFHDESDDEVFQTPRIRRSLRRNPQKMGFDSSAMIASVEQDSPLPSYFRKFFK